MTAWPRGRSADGGIDEIPFASVTGRLWLCGKHVVGPDPEAALARVGADHVLCLNERHEIEHRYPGYVSWLEGDGRERSTWFPTPDLGTRPLDDFLGLLEATAQQLQSGRGLIVHCGAGIGRAGTFAVCALVLAGADPAEALLLVADHRPLAGPEAGSQAELVDVVEAVVAAKVGPSTKPFA